MTTIDPATIVLALSLGAAACHQDHCPPTVQDAYCDLKTTLQAAYPAVHIALLEEDPKRQLYRALLAEDLTRTGAHQDHTIRSQAAALFFAVHHHAPTLPLTVGVRIENAVAAGSILVQDITSSADGVVIQAAQAGHNIQVSNVQSGPTGAATAAPPTTVSIHGSSAGEGITINTAPTINYNFPDQEAARRLPELEAIDATNRQRTGQARVELKLTVDFEAFTVQEQAKLQAAIGQLLGIQGIYIVNTRPGSTLVTLQLPDSVVDTLAELIYAGALAEYGVTAIRRIYNLSGADLTGADLFGADLIGVNLTGADLTGAILRLSRYDIYTRWPKGFDYRHVGAIGPDTVLADTNLVDADLSGADLVMANLSNANLTNIDLRGTNLRGANLSNAKLINADLRGTNLRNTNLRGADLTRANLHGANLTWANFSGADLTRANLHGSDLTRADFTRAALTEAALHLSRYDIYTMWPKDFDYRHVGAIGPDTVLADADLAGVDLADANLSWADFRGANLTGANFRGANLTGANFRGANLTGANFRGADLTEADLMGTNLHRANLIKANLIGADLTGTNLRKANLRWANLRGASLRLSRYDIYTVWPKGFDHRHIGAIGPETVFADADLVRANLFGADLSRADLSKADFTMANLSGANLTGANLSRANLSGANLSRANLSGANLSGANLTDTNLTAITYDEHTIWPDDLDPVRATPPIRPEPPINPTGERPEPLTSPTREKTKERSIA